MPNPLKANTTSPRQKTGLGAATAVAPAKPKVKGEPKAVRTAEEIERAAANYAKRQKELGRLSKVARRVVPRSEDTGSELALFPKMLLTPAQFRVVAALIRSRDPAMSAARLVLVHGHSLSQAAGMVLRDGVPLPPQLVNNTVTRFKAAHTLICEGYKPGV